MSDFYAPASPPVLGDPRLDPPMVWRVEDWERRFDPTARRAVRTTLPGDRPWPWQIAAGPAVDVGRWLSHAEVADWPIAHGLLQAATFHHSATAAPAPAQSDERGDMTVEAFRTPKDTL